MNKYIKYAALLAILSLAILFSCQKNEDVGVDTTQQFEMTENAQLVYNKLVAFKQALDNPQKSTTSMQLDSAEWYVEAFYNVVYGFPDSGYRKFDVDKSTFTLNIADEGRVSIENLSIVLDEIENNYTALLLNAGQPSHLVVGDVEFDLNSRTDEIIVTVTSGIGSGTKSWHTLIGDEMWFFGHTKGRCDVPEQIYSDAGEEMEWRFNNPYYIPYPACANGNVKIIESTHEWDLGENNQLIYSEEIEGGYNPPCYHGDFWNNYLNNGFVLFFGDESEGGLIPDGNTFFTAVDIFSDTIPTSTGMIYKHDYQTFYSVYECFPSGGDLD
jgi:hypothetical protein